MAVNMRLESKNSKAYNDWLTLYPLTTVRNIVADVGDEVYGYNRLRLTIPASADVTQNIAIATTDAMLNSVYELRLLSDTTAGRKDFKTITGYRVTKNNLQITRLYDAPTGEIEAELNFITLGGK